MDIRYSANQKDVKRYTTQELRDEFLIKGCISLTVLWRYIHTLIVWLLSVACR